MFEVSGVMNDRELEIIMAKYSRLPLLINKEAVVLPGVQTILHLEDEHAIAAVQNAIERYGSYVIVVSQKEKFERVDASSVSIPDQVYEIGVIAKILKTSQDTKGTACHITIDALERITLNNIELIGDPASSENIEEIDELDEPLFSEDDTFHLFITEIDPKNLDAYGDRIKDMEDYDEDEAVEEDADFDSDEDAENAHAQFSEMITKNSDLVKGYSLKIPVVPKSNLMSTLTESINKAAPDMPADQHQKIFQTLLSMMRDTSENRKVDEPYYASSYTILPSEYILDQNIMQIVSDVISVFADYVNGTKGVNKGILFSVTSQGPLRIGDVITYHLHTSTADKQDVLETIKLYDKYKKVLDLVHRCLAVNDIEYRAQRKVHKKLQKTQKDFYLAEQMKSIQRALGISEDDDEFADIEKQLSEKKLSEEAEERVKSELKKLRNMSASSSEQTVVRTYIETILDLPWNVYSKGKVDVKKAEKILDEDHYGLEEVKERILEYLGVLQRSKNMRSPILCLVGPPGVGKTSLAQSIAKAVGRKYVRFALGGVHDESEIRGHRKTYLASMPGKILSLLKKAGESDPVFLLDEIDKMSKDLRGDPVAAMLEVLDPEQNKRFTDHYLDLEYDLSHVFFVATSNTLDIPWPLRDRMEIIKIPGYTEPEKLTIARNHLIAKVMKEHSMTTKEMTITDDAILEIIRHYTSESGVRSLERAIMRIARKALMKLLSDKSLKTVHIDEADIEGLLGVRKYTHDLAFEVDQIGVTTGLAYTDVGGELLSVEALLVPGKGEIKATGALGDVMKESAQAAFSFLRSTLTADKNNILKDHDIHLHFPAGATPKDGPSAGIAIYTTICSLMHGIPVRKDVAMTGEVTLRGKVLPIGGLREKLLAAKRGGITTVIIPKDNVKDLKKVPETIVSNLNIVPVDTADQVLNIALSAPYIAKIEVEQYDCV